MNALHPGEPHYGHDDRIARFGICTSCATEVAMARVAAQLPAALDQPTPTHPAPVPREFDGLSYQPELDGARLESQLVRVWRVMADGQWRTLHGIAAACAEPEASVSARLRDLRKTRFGGYQVERRRVTGGRHQYRLVRYEPAAEPPPTVVSGRSGTEVPAHS